MAGVSLRSSWSGHCRPVSHDRGTGPDGAAAATLADVPSSSARPGLLRRLLDALRPPARRRGATARYPGDFTGRVSARAQLTGAGETIRDAIGRSRGFIGLVVRNGTLPDRYAAALGFDAGRMLVAGDDSTAGLRCLVLRLNMRDGTGRVDPLVLDTTRSKLEGTGTVRFPEERIALRLTGAPKGDAILRLDGAALMNGTIRQPDLVIPREVKSIGNIFRSIGRAITGHGGPTASDADCGALADLALR